MMKNNKYKRGSGSYTCNACGKLTRETGNDESESRLCAFCFRLFSLENSYNDGHITIEEFNEKEDRLKKEYNR